VRRHADPLVVSSPPLMWVEALEMSIGALTKERSINVSEIAAIGGCAQQHGTVYLNSTGRRALGNLDSARPLPDQLRDIFSRSESPVWMDESTGRQCAEIAAALGGQDAVASLTGSRPFARFAGPQIRKFAEEDHAGYAATDRIHLVSSFMASLLLGSDAPIDPGDGAGMNLMDIRTLRWDRRALDATAPDLERRLPPIQRSSEPIGVLGRYWRERYGLPAALLIPWTGDNPSSLIGAGLVEEGDVGISLVRATRCSDRSQRHPPTPVAPTSLDPRQAATCCSCASATARWRASTFAIATDSIGAAFRGRCRPRRLETKVASCCPGSTPRSRRRWRPRVFDESGWSRRTVPRTSARSWKDR
jgi:sugar (pentulose or hexulose) kinase